MRMFVGRDFLKTISVCKVLKINLEKIINKRSINFRLTKELKDIIESELNINIDNIIEESALDNLNNITEDDLSSKSCIDWVKFYEKNISKIFSSNRKISLPFFKFLIDNYLEDKYFLLEYIVTHKEYDNYNLDDFRYLHLSAKDVIDYKNNWKRKNRKENKTDKLLGPVVEEYLYKEDLDVEPYVLNSLGSLDFLDGKTGTTESSSHIITPPDWFYDLFQTKKIKPISSYEQSWSSGIILEEIETKNGQKERPIKVGKFLEKIKATAEEKKEFEERNLEKKYNWIIKTDPKSVLTMSYDRGWKSCMRPEGAYSYGPAFDVWAGSAIIYFYKNNPNKPCGREILRPGVYPNGKPFIVRGGRIYGDGVKIPAEEITTKIPIIESNQVPNNSFILGINNDGSYLYMDGNPNFTTRHNKEKTLRQLEKSFTPYKKPGSEETMEILEHLLKKHKESPYNNLEQKPKKIKPNKYEKITEDLFPEMGHADDNVIAKIIYPLCKIASTIRCNKKSFHQIISTINDIIDLYLK
jgi:hypothetical protein